MFTVHIQVIKDLNIQTAEPVIVNVNSLHCGQSLLTANDGDTV